MTRILIAAFDGLLPQQVSPDLTPTIFRLTESGVTFTRHHAVYPTVTRVNSAAMVTGCYSGKHGIPANYAVFRDHDPNAAIQVLRPELDALASNPDTPVLFVPTVGELLAEQGLTHVSIVGGSSGNAYVHFPLAGRIGNGGVIHPEFSLPEDLGVADKAALGPWPGSTVPGIERVTRVADSACKFVIPEINPDLLFVWFPEPDGANHAYGVGSAQSNRGLSEADQALARILNTLDENGDRPDVLVISDHGYSTISNTVDVSSELQSAGFETGRGEGSVIVGNNGGSVLLDYPGADENGMEKLSAWMLEQPWAGSVFSTEEIALAMGMLPVESAMMLGRRAPQFAASMAWNDSVRQNDLVGTAWNGGHSPIGAGLHGSASPHELRNTLIGSGPSFKAGVSSSIPSGNVDLTPTVLALLDQSVPPHMDGRVLTEALVGGPDQSEIEVGSHEVRGSQLRPKTREGNPARMVAKQVSVNGSLYLESAGTTT